MANRANIGIAVGLGLLALMGLSKPAKAAPPKPPEKCDTGPYPFDPVQIQVTIEQAIDAGMRSKMKVAVWVARKLWPKNPDTKQPVNWPPGAGATEFQLCVWDLLSIEIDIYFDEEGIPPWPDCPPGRVLENDECVAPGPKPVDPSPWENESRWPKAGTLLQTQWGDRLLGTKSPTKVVDKDFKGNQRSIIYSTLLSSAYLAAKEVGGVSDAEAKSFALDVATDVPARLAYLELLYCVPWNDALYETYGYGSSVGNFDSPMGRAFRFLPHNYDNRKRITQGLPPRRNIALGKPSDNGKGNAWYQNQNVRAFEYLWLPAINLEILWNSGGQTITTQGMVWEDGSTMLMPPPPIVQLGVENVPSGMWGCDGHELVSTEEL